MRGPNHTQRCGHIHVPPSCNMYCLCSDRHSSISHEKNHMNRTVPVRAFTSVTISTQSCSKLYTWPPSEGRAIVKRKEGLRGC